MEESQAPLASLLSNIAQLQPDICLYKSGPSRLDTKSDSLFESLDTMWALEWLSLSGLFSKDTQESRHTVEASGAERPQLESNDAVPGGATESSGSDRPEQERDSPILRLPAELRIMIYDFALQDTLDAAAAIETKIENGEPGPRFKQPLFSPFVGALALRQTNRKLLNEGLDIMIPLVHAKAEKLHNASDLAAAHYQAGERNREEAQARSDAFWDAYSLLNLLSTLTLLGTVYWTNNGTPRGASSSGRRNCRLSRLVMSRLPAI